MPGTAASWRGVARIVGREQHAARTRKPGEVARDAGRVPLTRAAQALEPGDGLLRSVGGGHPAILPTGPARHGRQIDRQCPLLARTPFKGDAHLYLKVTVTF